MAEANAAEPNERAAPPPRRPRRKHAINLCCAQSVHRVVEEVARSLEGLGFQVAVVTGAEARAALLGSRTDAAQPTIHVVCVQGSLQERVLKPLRQALATHGGPNHHLFVAVLDLGVPLAMVGQIRRFAEALERTGIAGPATAAGGAPPEGRETLAQRDLDHAPTRSYPSLTKVVERGGTKPPLAAEGDDAGERPARRTRPLGARPNVAKLVPTSKYQAVTASNPVVPAEPGVRKRRRARSRLSPSARRRPSEERVLGLPEQDQSRHAPGARREPPPPPPGDGARRRSATPPPSATATPPPPPPTRSPSSTSLPAVDAAVKGNDAPKQPPELGKPDDAAEPDRVQPRLDAGFRFTPPGVKAPPELRRPQSGPIPVVPLADVLRDPDKTVVEGVLAEVPRTASTLRLDEPPFADGPAPRAKRSGPSNEAASSDENPEEPVEPTMILAAPSAPEEVPDEDIEELDEVDEVDEVETLEPTSAPPAKTGSTVVGPPPTPSPATLAELERGRASAQQASAAEARAGTESLAGLIAGGPRKTIGYVQREEPAPAFERATTLVSESSRTLMRQPAEGGDAPSPTTLPALVQRPIGSPEPAQPSSESSGTLVLRPRASGLDSGPITLADEEPSAETSGTVALRPRAGAAKPSAEASGAALRPRLGDVTPSEGPTGTVVQPAPTEDAHDVSESAKTLLRSDGSFESSHDLMQKIEASRRVPASESSPPAAASEPTFKPGKTVLYAESISVPAATSDASTPTEQGGTAVSSAPASTARPPGDDQARTIVTPTPAPTSRSTDDEATAPSASTSSAATSSAATSSASTSSASTSSAATSSAEPDAARPAARRVPPSAVPTERHPVAASEPVERTRVRKTRGAPPPAQASRSGVLESESPKPAAATRAAKPHARPKRAASRYGWLWILLALLTAGGGWGAYQAGLLDDLLGRSRSTSSTVADASSHRPPAASDPALTTPAADGGATKAGNESAGDSASSHASAGQPSATTTTPPPEPTADDATSGGQAPDPSTGDLEPAAGSTGAPEPTPTEPTPPEPTPTEPTPPEPTPTEPTPTEPTPTEPTPPEPTPPAEPSTGPGPRLSAEEQTLTPAVDARRIFMLKTLYTTKRQGSATTFAGGWQRCATLEVDGVKGWRLPHRREMKLVNAVLNLPTGSYWTRTVPPEDKSAAYVLDSSNGDLSLFLKTEPNGEVVCVRERDYPEK